jgi:hypothetical protein
MSFNDDMHPRNIYRAHPPDFKQLAEKCVGLKSFLIERQNGTVTLDFRDPQAVRALTIALAKEHFQLNLELSLGKINWLLLLKMRRHEPFFRSIDSPDTTETQLSTLARRSVESQRGCHRH